MCLVNGPDFCFYDEALADRQNRTVCIRHGKQLLLAPEFKGLSRAAARAKWQTDRRRTQER